MIISEVFKDLAFSILDKSKQRGYHLFRDLKFYSSQFNWPVENIFDVGANIGQTSRELRKYFPNSMIHAFEPIDSTFDILRANLYQDKKTILNNVALGAEEKEVTILLKSESRINSLLNEIKANAENLITTDKQRHIQTIKVISGDNYCNLNNIESIFLLKTDTEGYDLDVLRGFKKMILDKKILFILVEVTFDHTNLSQTNFSKVNEYLTLHGFRLSGFYDLIHHDGFYPNLSYCNCLFSLPLEKI